MVLRQVEPRVEEDIWIQLAAEHHVNEYALGPNREQAEVLQVEVEPLAGDKLGVDGLEVELFDSLRGGINNAGDRLRRGLLSRYKSSQHVFDCLGLVELHRLLTLREGLLERIQKHLVVALL